MTVAITQYTDSNAVRGALGVDDQEVTDAMLEDQNLSLALEVDLEEWLPTHATLWTDGTAADSTAAEKLVVKNIRLYAMWFCAVRVAETPYAIPQSLSDGKTEVRRQSFSFEKVLELARARADYYKRKLSSTPTVTLFSSASPDYDPVTNAG